MDSSSAPYCSLINISARSLFPCCSVHCSYEHNTLILLKTKNEACEQDEKTARLVTQSMCPICYPGFTLLSPHQATQICIYQEAENGNRAGIHTHVHCYGMQMSNRQLNGQGRNPPQCDFLAWLGSFKSVVLPELIKLHV